MIRSRPTVAVIGALAVALGGCAGPDADTSSTIAPSTTTTVAAPTTTSTTTTLSVATEMPRAPGRLVMRPETTYTASRFWTPFTLMVDEVGWWVRGVEETWGYLEYYGPGGLDQTRPDLGRILDLSFVANATRSDPESVIAAFIARDHIEALTEVVVTTVAGRDAWVADIVNTDEGRAAASGAVCDIGRPHSAYWDPDPGVSMYTVIDPRDATTAHLGLAACRTARIWAVDVDGETIVIIAATTNPEFDDLIPSADRLVAGIEFES